MPWLSMPMTPEGAKHINKLSAKLSVRSIPQLIVLDAKTGRYVTNDAKSQVVHVGKDVARQTQLINSWKDAQSVPLDQANLGIMSSIFSKVKQGLGFGGNNDSQAKKVRDDGSDGDDDRGYDTGIGSNDNNAYTIMSFFNEANERLKEYPNEEERKSIIQPLDNCVEKGNEYFVPVSLKNQRQALLETQLRALETTVSRVSEEKKTSVTAKDIQEHLRALGAKDFTNITADAKIQTELLDQMNDMNEHARMAFARSVLWSEHYWDQQEREINKIESDGVLDYAQTKRKLHQKGDGISMDRNTVIEFSGLCSTLVKLPEVENHLQSGRKLFDNSDMGEEYLVSDNVTAPQRVLHLQYMMLCSVGFEPICGGEELYKIMTQDHGAETDVELAGSISSYIMAMQTASKKAMDEGLNQVLSDANEGGDTRVVSVVYSEKTVNQNHSGELIQGGDTAPSHERMEEHNEEQQRQQLQVAANAARLQQTILEQLNAMEENERNVHLSKAEAMHNDFVRNTMSLPPGPERIAFLQSISAEQQHLLLIHKLWANKSSS